MLRLILALSVLLFCGSIGAFFLFVPPLLIVAALIATVLLLLTGFGLLFHFGTQAELQPAPPSDDIDRTN